MEELKTILGGLSELPPDERDLSVGALYRLPKLEEIPDDFIVGNSEVVDDQKESDLCSAYTVANASAQQEGQPVSSAYQFAKIKELLGSPDGFGADLRTACKSATKVGSIPRRIAPFTLEANGRNFVADWRNWPKYLDDDAVHFKKDSYLAVKGPYDLFDNIRATLWLFRNEKRQVITGAKFRYSWVHIEGGVVPVGGYENDFLPHAFRVVGSVRLSERLGGELCLVASLSNGTQIGDRGIFYIPRGVVNNEFTYGAYTFKDIDPEVAKYLTEKKLGAGNAWWAKVLVAILKLFT